MGCTSSKTAEPVESKPDDIKVAVEVPAEKVKSEDTKASTEKIDVTPEVEELKSKKPVEATATNPVADTGSYFERSNWNLDCVPLCGGVGDAEPAPEPERA